MTERRVRSAAKISLTHGRVSSRPLKIEPTSPVVGPISGQRRIDDGWSEFERNPEARVAWVGQLLGRVAVEEFGADQADIAAWKQSIAEALAGDSDDIRKVRKWVATHELSDDASGSFGLRLMRMAVLMFYAVVDVDSQQRDKRSSADAMEAFDAVADAAEALAKVLETKRHILPPLPPLWYFLDDTAASSLLRTLDRSRNGRRDSSATDAMLLDVKVAQDRWDASLAAAGDSETSPPAKDSRRYRYARHIVSRTLGFPHRWFAAEGEEFLCPDTPDLMRALARHVRGLRKGIDQSTNYRAGGSTRVREKLLVRQLHTVVCASFNVDPARQPWAFLAQCVRVVMAARYHNKSNFTAEEAQKAVRSIGRAETRAD